MPAYIHAFHAAFVEIASAQTLQGWQTTWESEGTTGRAIAAFEEGAIVVTSGIKHFELTLPGSTSIPAAGITAVSVLPTHRRRGILNEMMSYELEDARNHGEIAAILYASEAVIYGRYGYGPATQIATYRVKAGRPAFRKEVPTSSLTLLDAERARTRVADIANRHARLHPGSIPRSDVIWDDWFGRSGPYGSASERFFVIHQNAEGNDDGFMAYRAQGDPSSLSELPLVTVVLSVSLSDTAYAALWQYLVHLDMVGEIEAESRPLDEPLRWLLHDARQVRTMGLKDGLWVRPLDVPACLEARRYFKEGSVAMRVEDSFCAENSGTYHLEVIGGVGHCARTTAEPDLVLEVAQLGSVYLGGVSFLELAAAGLAEEHKAGCLLLAEQMFRSPVSPWCSTFF